MSISSEITRIANNVQNTIDTIGATGVTVPDGANSDDLPSLAAALANEKQDKLTGSQGQFVGFTADNVVGAVDAPDGLPSGGEEGQVLTKTASGAQWDDVPSDLPAGGTDGQILTKTADGVAWEDAPEGGVTSFNGRTGAVTPQAGDYTADMVGARADTWTPSAEDVGADPAGSASQALMDAKSYTDSLVGDIASVLDVINGEVI